MLAKSEKLTRTDSAEKKRVRDESDEDVVIDSPEVKRLRDDLFDVLDNLDPEPVNQDLDSEKLTRLDSAEKKLVRDDSDVVIDSPEVKRLREDLFILDDLDSEPVSQDLDSVMKSFEDELSSTVKTTTTTSQSETQPDLGYLLEASDDELGLPPISPILPVAKEEDITDLVRASSASSGIDEIWGFDDSNYGGLDFGSGVGDGGDYVAVDGLFEFSEGCFDSGDLSTWRSESLPAE